MAAEFLHTETKPKIYYSPAKHSKRTEDLLERQRREALHRLSLPEKENLSVNDEKVQSSEKTSVTTVEMEERTQAEKAEE
jgi:hypothetical protein